MQPQRSRLGLHTKKQKPDIRYLLVLFTSVQIIKVLFNINDERTYQNICLGHCFTRMTNERMSMRYTYFSCRELCLAIDFLIDNIYVRFGSSVFRRVIGIPMGTNSAPLLADLFLHTFEYDFMVKTRAQDNTKAIQFSNTFRYIDDLPIYSVLTMWTLEITSVQFTRRNCNLRTLPHHLLKCVISTQISRRAVQYQYFFSCILVCVRAQFHFVRVHYLLI